MSVSNEDIKRIASFQKKGGGRRKIAFQNDFERGGDPCQEPSTPLRSLLGGTKELKMRASTERLNYPPNQEGGIETGTGSSLSICQKHYIRGKNSLSEFDTRDRGHSI